MKAKDFLYLALLTAGSLFVHGYHPGAEDAEIYVPGIKVLINSSLYPFGREFFLSQTRMTFFPNLVAASVRFSHLPFDLAIFLWHFLSIFLLLLACLQLSRWLFSDERASWAGVSLLAALLTLPVTGTALYIVDQYLNPRALALFASIFATTAVLQRKYLQAALWLLFAAVIHPLMAVFMASWIFFLVVIRHFELKAIPALSLLPLGIFLTYPSPAYRELVQRYSDFFVLRWPWYEWLGIFGPLLILYGLSRLAHKRGQRDLDTVCRAVIPFGLFYFLVAVIFSISDRLIGLARFQPLRSLQIVYTLLVVICGGFLGKWLMKNRVWPWLVLCGAVSVGMFIAARQLFPASPQIEWPGVVPRNDWLQAFAWIKSNTPTDAFFALNHAYMHIPGEDYQGFRAHAERSRLADNVKDAGAASLFPGLPLAEHLKEQLDAQNGWANYELADFERLRKQYGVTWVLLDQKKEINLDCPYANATLRVCRLP